MKRLSAPLIAPFAVMAALTALVLTGCSSSDSGSSSDSDGGSAAQASVPSDGLTAQPDPASGAEDSASESDSDSAPDSATGDARKDDANALARTAADYDRRVIRTGTVELHADDVGKAVFDVQRLVDRHHGQVAQEETNTDDAGDAAYTRMVLRVPEAEFATVVDGLEKVAKLVTSSTDEEDVSTKVIDLQTRIAVQKRSIARITTLFERAEKIRDVMAIESELASRQADLDSLEQQAAYLDGQTTLSTITVSIDQTAKAATREKADESGFLGGLSAGWGALTTFGGGLATVTGALLPWLVVLALLAPLALGLSRVVRRRLGAQRG